MHGAFGGAPPRPADDYDTLAITHRLVANENVAVDTVTDLTRFLLTEEAADRRLVPIAQRMEAPSTDKDAAMPVHAGAAAYIDDDEQTFFDKYSDMIYLGAMFLGVLASGATAVLGRINGRRTASVERVGPPSRRDPRARAHRRIRLRPSTRSRARRTNSWPPP